MDNTTAQLNVVNLCLILQLKAAVIPGIIPQAIGVNSGLHRQLSVHTEKHIGPKKERSDIFCLSLPQPSSLKEYGPRTEFLHPLLDRPLLRRLLLASLFD